MSGPTFDRVSRAPAACCIAGRTKVRWRALTQHNKGSSCTYPDSNADEPVAADSAEEDFVPLGLSSLVSVEREQSGSVLKMRGKQ